MTTTPHRFESDFARRYFSAGEAEGKAEGKAEGRAEAVLAVLATRGIEVTDADRDQIVATTDLAQLDDWIRRAVTATSIDDLFG